MHHQSVACGAGPDLTAITFISLLHHPVPHSKQHQLTYWCRVSTSDSANTALLPRSQPPPSSLHTAPIACWGSTDDQIFTLLLLGLDAPANPRLDGLGYLNLTRTRVGAERTAE